VAPIDIVATGVYPTLSCKYVGYFQSAGGKMRDENDSLSEKYLCQFLIHPWSSQLVMIPRIHQFGGRGSPGIC
jgi:hypothetical protein